MAVPLPAEFPTPPAYLFVYGTLRQQAETEQSRLLESQARYVDRGCVKGLLYRIAHYPGLVISDSSQGWVVGEVFEVLTPESLFRKLDEYEGCGPSDPQPHEYRRQRAPVLCDSGDWIEADTYVYQWGVEGREPIVSGDFFA